jgi:hypothetical protein
MEMFLQFGHGMMGHSRELLGAWREGGVILSPRDLTGDQINRLAEDLTAQGAECLLDPQCFSTDADHYRLVQHAYFRIIIDHPRDVFQGGTWTAELLRQIAQLSRLAGIHRHILPCPLANPVNDDWFAAVEAVIDEAPRQFGNEPILATIALSTASVLDEFQLERVVERARRWNASGFYVIAETPGAYLVDNPVWLTNLLVLVSGLKLLRKFVLVGYCNHQMLCMAAANADAIASGTWLNVRAFPPGKFFTPSEEEVSRRALWCYCPQALSEYKIAFLDIARSAGVLGQMRPDLALGCRYADPLFSGPPPTSINWGEQESFRHYLTCLHGQARAIRRDGFQHALEDNLRALDAAEILLRGLRAAGIYGQDREFSPYVDVNRAALTRLSAARGQQLQRHW